MDQKYEGLQMNNPAITVTVFAKDDSPRLRYVLDWLIIDRLGLDYQLTNDRSTALNAATGLAYGWVEGPPSIRDAGFLWETGAGASKPELAEWEGLQAMYLDVGSPCDIQFDMFSGIFYLLSRYEEYGAFEPDRHGRYPAKDSVLFDILERPVVDEWVESLRVFLEQVWSVPIPAKRFSYESSYDIDIAWKYLNKGWKRSLGATLGDLVKGRFAQLKVRFAANANDPWDSYVFLFAQHMMDDPMPLYFVLASEQTTAWDKNIPATHPRMQKLIEAFGNSRLGMHPSYFSDERPERLPGEKALLERISGQQITRSRQHFIKLKFPQTYRRLIDAGITDDYSMGYSTTFGFRAGTGMPFLWYDLEMEVITALRVHPFPFMDTTGHFDLGLNAEESFLRLRAMTEKLIATNSRLITVMHNFSLGVDVEWKGWRGKYEAFLNDMRNLQS